MKAGGTWKERLEDRMKMGKNDFGMEGFSAKHLRGESCQECDGFVGRVIAGWEGEVYRSQYFAIGLEIQVIGRMPTFEHEVMNV